MTDFIRNNPIKLVLIGLFLVPWFFVNLFENSGICFSEMRIFTDKEMMEFAIKDKFNRGELKLDIKDTSVSAFLKNHPDCCYVYKSRGLFNLYGLLTGERNVYVKFELSRKAINSGKGAGGTYFEQEINMSTCGEIIHLENLGGYTPK